MPDPAGPLPPTIPRDHLGFATAREKHQDRLIPRDRFPEGSVSPLGLLGSALPPTLMAILDFRLP